MACITWRTVLAGAALFGLEAALCAQGANTLTLSALRPARTQSSDAGDGPIILRSQVTPPDTRGDVTFWDGGAFLGLAPLVEGQATLVTTKLGLGVRHVHAEYSASGPVASGSQSAALSAALEVSRPTSATADSPREWSAAAASRQEWEARAPGPQKTRSNNSSFSLGIDSVIVGPSGGSSSVLLAASDVWTAVSNAAWLHIRPGSESGSGNALILFTCDLTSGSAPRAGTLTVAGLTLTVTQAGNNDLLINPPVPLLTTGLQRPSGAAIDSSGTVYVADPGNQTVDQWNPVAQTLLPVSFYVPLTNASGVAVDLPGNLYVANTGGNSIVKWNPATQQSSAIFSSGLNGPTAVAVDTQGNIYVSDTGNNAVERWAPGGTSPTAVLTGLQSPSGIAVDVLGSVYVADTGNAAVKKWNPLTQEVTVLVSSGLLNPTGVAVDGQGNVYIADAGANAIFEWNAGTQNLIAVAGPGLAAPRGVALDGSGNVYIVDSGNQAVKRLASVYAGPRNLSEGPLAGTDAFHVLPANAAVSVASDQSWLSIINIGQGMVSFSFTANPFLTARSAHIGIFGQQVTITQSGNTATSISKVAGDGQSAVPGQTFSAALKVLVTNGAGDPVQGAAVTFTVFSGSGGAGASFNSASQTVTTTDPNGMAVASGLTANSVAGTYSVSASAGSASVSFALSNLLASLNVASTIVGGGAGAGALVLNISPSSATWTATSNAAWIHIAPGSATGSGTGAIQFSYDVNTTGAAQTGTITAGGQTFTITQAPGGSVQVGSATTLLSSGLNLPFGVAVDTQGNLYIADTGHNAVQKWNANTQQLSTLVSSGLNAPRGVAVDTQGNVYIADSYNNAIKEWSNATAQVSTLISSGLSFPVGVAVDAAGNVSIADFGNNAVKQWSPGSQQLRTLIGSGLNGPVSVTADARGNVYVADLFNNAVKQWSAGTQQVIALALAGLRLPSAVALDAQGNTYVLDGNQNTVRQWNLQTQQSGALLTGAVDASLGVAADSLGNLYVANPGTGTIQKITAAYLSFGSTSVVEGARSGSDSVSVQTVPSGFSLTASSDQTWLTAGAVAGGNISFSFQTNSSAIGRIGHLLVLGQAITVTQSGSVAATVTKVSGDGQSVLGGVTFPSALQVAVKDASGNSIQGATVTFAIAPAASASFAAASTVTTDANGIASAPSITAGMSGGPFSVTATANPISTVFSLSVLAGSLASSSATLGSAAGSSSVLLVFPGAWTASGNASWIHIAANSANGTGSAAVQFSVDANATALSRTGTLTIAGSTFTVVQAGSTYAAAYPLVTLLSNGLKAPLAAAADAQGNLYIADTGNNAIRKWTASTQQVTTLVSAGLNAPSGIAVDAAGNVYFSDSNNNAIKEWVAATQTAAAVPFAGLAYPFGVAIDSAGNLYVTDNAHNAVKKRAPNGQVTTLISSGLSSPRGIALDALGNVYLADTKNNAVKEWNATTKLVTSLVPSGLSGPTGVAADGQGNIYIADTTNGAIKKFNQITQQTTALPLSGLKGPTGVIADASGNLYIVDSGNGAIKKVIPGYLTLPAPAQTTTAAAGMGSVAVASLPATLPLSATSDKSWLTVTGMGTGVVSFTYQANTSAAARAAHIGILGLVETITQGGDIPVSLTIAAGNSQRAVVNTAFATPLQVKVSDSNGMPISSATVTFTVLAGSKASATFPGPAASATAITGTTGLATAPTLTAGNTAGALTVKATVASVGAAFSLTVALH